MKVFINERMHISGAEWIPDSQAEFDSNIEQILSVLGCFNFFDKTNIYFNSEGIGSLIENLKIIGNEYFLFNPIDQLRTILIDIEAVDWSINKVHRDDHLYFIQLDRGATVHPVNTTTIAEAAEYNFLGDKVFLINLLSSEINNLPTLYVNRININPPGNMNLLQIEKVSGKEETIQHLLNERNQPVFNWNPKHGENGRGMIPNENEVVSPLLCNKAEASDLLSLCVNSKKTDELYGYDRRHDKFIVFKNEYTLTNTYHPYHPINQEEVPTEVRIFILSSTVLNPHE